MKVVAVLKHPNIDVIADADVLKGWDTKNAIEMRNVAVMQWMGDYVKIIPFSAAKDNTIDMRTSNVAMLFEADKKIGEIHDEEMKKPKKSFLSKTEFETIARAREEEKAKVINRNK